MKNSTKSLIIIGSILVVFLVVGIVLASTMTGTKEMTYNELQKKIIEGDVTSISVSNDTATVRLHNQNKEFKVYVRDELLIEFINEHDTEHAITLKFNDRYAVNVWQYVFYAGLAIVLVLVFVFMFRGLGASNKQVMNFGKSGVNAQSSLKVRFTDVAGADEEKEELAEIVDFLKSPQKFTAAGARVPRGVLLVGPPGTGKTLLAKAIAGEASVPFFSISGSDFVEMYVGVGASRVRDLFETAKKNKPCIIFIDEIDAVGRQRGAGLGGGHDEREQTLNQLLVQMDGFETSDDIIVIAATNRADILDPALLRPGRFDRQIYVNRPDVKGREAIFKVHARNKTIAPDVDFKILARITSGFSGADIANLLNEAAILCARKGRTVITKEDIYEGINKVILGPQKRSRLISEVDKRQTAYHESGHAVVAKVLPDCDNVQEVSIIPRGPAGGYTLTRPDDDTSMLTLKKLKANLAMTMGGRAAEEVFIQEVTTGPSGDIKQATSLARQMVTELGMSKLGPVFYGTGHEVFLGRDYGASHAYSEDIAAKIDSEVNALLDEAYATAKKILEEHRDKIDVMVRVLTEAETIYSEQVDMIMNGSTVQEVLQSMEDKEKNDKQ